MIKKQILKCITTVPVMLYMAYDICPRVVRILSTGEHCTRLRSGVRCTNWADSPWTLAFEFVCLSLLSLLLVAGTYYMVKRTLR